MYKSHFGEFDWFISCICSIIRVLINIGDKMNKQHLIYTERTLQELKGVGPKSLQLLNELNIYTLEDLVLYLPTRYEDESVINLNEATDGDVVTVTGEVYSSPTVAFLVEINLN